jgi:MFS family permease
MTQAIAAAVPPSGILSRRAGFYVLASITISFLAGSAAPTPLYPVYQAQWGFSPTMVTAIFGIYALAVLSALLVVGRLSDHIGRKPVLLVATVVQAATMILFAHADGLNALLLARVIQGLSTGAAVAAVGAGLLDLDKTRGTMANAITTPLGTATGAIVAGVLVQYLPQPTHLVYYVLAVIFVVQAFGVMLLPEPNAPRAGAWASLKPQFRLPVAARGPMLLAIPALVATWALAGFYASLGPTVIRGLLGSNSALLGGLTLFVLATSAALAVSLLHNRDARVLMTVGAVALVAGVTVFLASLSYHSAAAFFVGTAMAGMGFGAGFQGAVRTVVASAPAHERAGVLSVAFVVSYLAMGLPAIAAGYLLTRQGNVIATAREFGAVIMMLAVLAIYGALRR